MLCGTPFYPEGVISYIRDGELQNTPSETAGLPFTYRTNPTDHRNYFTVTTQGEWKFDGGGAYIAEINEPQFSKFEERIDKPDLHWFFHEYSCRLDSLSDSKMYCSVHLVINPDSKELIPTKETLECAKYDTEYFQIYTKKPN